MEGPVIDEIVLDIKNKRNLYQDGKRFLVARYIQVMIESKDFVIILKRREIKHEPALGTSRPNAKRSWF